MWKQADYFSQAVSSSGAVALQLAGTRAASPPPQAAAALQQSSSPPPVPRRAAGAAGSATAAVVTSPGKPANPDGALTASFVRGVAKDNLVMVTWANFHYLDFVENWVAHLRALGVSNFVVGAMDNKMLKALQERGIPCFAMNLNTLTLGDFGWGSPTFHKMGRQKIALISRFTDFGVDILLTDVDTAWERDPNEYVQRPELRHADVLTSSDHLGTTLERGDDGLERWPQAGSAFNIGIMLFRATTAAKDFARTWQEAIDADPKYWDQSAFNDLARKGGTKPFVPPGEADGSKASRLFVGWEGRLTVGVLSVSLFASGHTGFVQRAFEPMGFERPYVVHATFQFAGTEGKRHRMREAMTWIDPPEYYAPEGGVVALDFAIPEALLSAQMYDGSMEGLSNHFALVHYSLRRMRHAHAVAAALGRALVLPKVMCGADRVWFPHKGVFPGSKLTLPFVCPADHFLEVDKWDKALRNTKARAVPFREHSFLDNPRRPKDAQANTARVRVCARDEASGCAAPAGGVAMRAGMSDDEWRQALSKAGLNDKPTLVLEGALEEAFGSFQDQADQSRHEDFLRKVPAPWGQITRKGGPGHVWYDFFADVTPWTDKFRRTRTCEWTPVLGEKKFPCSPAHEQPQS